MPRSRDRHGRGIRGPLALPHAFSPSPVPLHRPNRSEFFNECVTDAMSAVAAVNSRAFEGILVGVEDVPQWSPTLSADRVPMSAALEGSGSSTSQVVLYQRPLEHRAATRPQLRRLVYRTIVEQLSALTGIGITDLTGLDENEWDD
ncbi:MAG: metallopeptidase family protein [Arachnia sp.]